MAASKQQLNDWYQVLQEAGDIFTQAEKVEGRTVAERTKKAYDLRNRARTKVSNVKYAIGAVVKEMDSAASEDDGE